MSNSSKTKNNRTLTITESEINKYSSELLKLKENVTALVIVNKIIHQDIFKALEYLPNGFVDLLFVDPPYNMNKTFNSNKFAKRSVDEYTIWVDNLMQNLVGLLKPTASIYFCGDWLSSGSIFPVLSKYFIVRNRITWEREKGRGAKTNWKNSSEDIWFATVSKDYVFNVESVKLKRKVLAPYKDNGVPKDWEEKSNGAFRLTHPSNIWTDITVPFWSMPENTEHPTQKPEKLLAKLILASSNKGDVVFDPFLGSGTTAVVAKKLNRKFVGVELDLKFAAIALKRLEKAIDNSTIQGLSDGVFWERNSLNFQNNNKK